jgi:hypothetical protein
MTSVLLFWYSEKYHMLSSDWFGSCDSLVCNPVAFVVFHFLAPEFQCIIKCFG